MMKNMMIPALFTFLFLFTFPCLISSNLLAPRISITGFEKISLPPNTTTTGSFTFGLFNEGPYIGVVDGRILKYNKLSRTFEDFAYTSPDRTSAFCDGTTDFNKLQTCGFPAGLSPDPATGKIYATDSGLGLDIVGLSGGLATNLVPSKDGVPYHTLIDVDAAINRKAYFVDASSIYNLRDINTSVLTLDSTGKLLEYDSKTKVVTELLTGLGGPAGVASDSIASTLYVAEYTLRRIRKYYINGFKAGTSEIILQFVGSPFQITRIKGEDNFWVPVNTLVTPNSAITQAVKFSSAGQILAIVDLTQEFTQLVSTVYQQGNELYVTGFNTAYLGKYQLVYS
ncbi:OLC1v1014028C1 [Oldenlandia corymbosa var. corymbosa]|uniref:OLC1v1014028C1 n=1 Tax=Oldenlandia corymbosa var. corymbosa TaxID=529605 RepID=A0AAV1E306_OLDCO|nr:OLC1v1014028C1 [Oldenlandia corymbosa var. corymbosa]